MLTSCVGLSVGCEGQARANGDGAELLHGQAVARVTWHARGDYFASVAPTGNTQARRCSPMRT